MDFGGRYAVQGSLLAGKTQLLAYRLMKGEPNEKLGWALSP
jgi:hypothetical protein